jgi:hypothetical protein
MTTPRPSEPTLDAGPCRLRPWRLDDPRRQRARSARRVAEFLLGED